MATFPSTSVKAAAALVLLSALCLGDEAFTVSLRSVQGTLTGKGAAVNFAGESGHVALADLARVRMGECGEAAPLVSGVVARDGSVLRGSVTLADGGLVKVASARLGQVSVPLADALEIHFESRREFPNAAGAGVLFLNGDFVPVNSMTVGPASVKLVSLLGELEVPLERVAALRLAVPDGGRRGAEASVVLDNGDVVNGSLAEAGETFKVATAFGEVAVARPSVSAVDFPARMAYISGLPESVSARGFAPEGIAYVMRDAALDGALRSPRGSYRKGLWTRAGAAVRVELPAGARALFFVPAIARGAKPAAGRFAIEAGGREIWSAALDAETPDAPVAVELEGAASVTFLYESRPAGLIGSAGVWGDAFVTIGPVEKE